MVIEDDVLEGVLITMSEPTLVPKFDLGQQIKELLRKNPEGLSKTDIYKTLGVHHTRSGPIVDQFVEKGEVEELGGGNKRRFVLVTKADA